MSGVSKRQACGLQILRYAQHDNGENAAGGKTPLIRRHLATPSPEGEGVSPRIVFTSSEMPSHSSLGVRTNMVGDGAFDVPICRGGVVVYGGRPMVAPTVGRKPIQPS